MMSLHHTIRLQYFFSPVKEKCIIEPPSSSGTSPLSMAKRSNCNVSSSRIEYFVLSSPNFLSSPSLAGHFQRRKLSASRTVKNLKSGDQKKDEGEESSESDRDGDEPSAMDEGERHEWRKMIREVIDKNPDVEEELDPGEKKNRMQKLLAEYPLVVEEEDPDWPEDSDGRGFNLDQFFNKITIKNVKKDDDDDNDDNENEVVWQDDDYIRPIKDITTAEWEETVYKDISPLVVLVHNRYKRPKENEKARKELEDAIHIIWNCRLPSPRCVAIDAVVELDLVSALKVSVFPEIVFTKAGKILYREKAIRTADELSKIMAFFYYGAAKPPCLSSIANSGEAIPSVPISN